MQPRQPGAPMVVRRSGQQGRGDPALSRSPARLARAWRRHGRAPRRRRVTLGGENARGGAAGRRRYLPGPATGGRVCCGAGARRLGSCEASPPRAWLPAHSPVSSAPHRSAICPAAASVRVGHAWVHSQLALCGAHPQLWWVPASEACAYNKCVCCFSQYRLRFKPQTGDVEAYKKTEQKQKTPAHHARQRESAGAGPCRA